MIVGVGFGSVLICSVDDGKPTLANLRNAGGAGRPSIVARNVRVRRGVRGIGFGVVLRMLMRMLLIGIGRGRGVNIHHTPTPTHTEEGGYKLRSLELGMLLVFLLDVR